MAAYAKRSYTVKGVGPVDVGLRDRDDYETLVVCLSDALGSCGGRENELVDFVRQPLLAQTVTWFCGQTAPERIRKGLCRALRETEPGRIAAYCALAHIGVLRQIVRLLTTQEPFFRRWYEAGARADATQRKIARGVVDTAVDCVVQLARGTAGKRQLS